MENYVKRCVGLPGETVSVVGGQLHINGEAVENPEGLQMEHRVVFANQAEAQNAFRKLGLTKLDLGPVSAIPEGIAAVMALTEREVQAMMTLAGSVEPMSNAHRRGRLEMFPNVWGPEFNEWDPDNFGPVTLPEKGASVDLTPRNLDLYRRWITVYEGHELVEHPDGQVTLDGEPTTTYTFGMDGYWMMGDNRHRSADSRMWGFVPDNHIVGRASFIWFSKQNEAQHGEAKIRWDRMMKTVK